MNKLGFGCMMTAECEVEVFSLKSNRKKKPTLNAGNSDLYLFILSLKGIS